MTKLYVTEYAGVAYITPGGVPVPQNPPIASQVVDYTAGVAASTAFNPATKLIRIHADSICSVAFGTAPTATTGTARLIAGQTEYHGVPKGKAFKVSAITNT